MVKKKKKRECEEMQQQIKLLFFFDGGMKQIWKGMKVMMRKQVGKMDNRIATFKAQNGKMVSSSNEKLAEHHCKLGV